jgi:hypothetical protein
VYSDKTLTTFRRNVLPPSSGLESNLSEQGVAVCVRILDVLQFSVEVLSGAVVNAAETGTALHDPSLVCWELLVVSN